MSFHADQTSASRRLRTLSDKGCELKGGNELDRTVVHYRCVAPDHGRAGAGSGLTIHNGKWAYCAGTDVRTEHRWTETGGLPIFELRDWSESGGAVESALTAAEALHAELVRAVGLTSLRLEVAREGAPLAIDIGEVWPAPGRAELEIALADGSGTLGRVLIADSRRPQYHRLERGIAMQISARYVPLLRRWLTARATR